MIAAFIGITCVLVAYLGLLTFLWFRSDWHTMALRVSARQIERIEKRCEVNFQANRASILSEQGRIDGLCRTAAAHDAKLDYLMFRDGDKDEGEDE